MKHTLKKTFTEITAMGFVLLLISICLILLFWNPTNQPTEPNITTASPMKGHPAPNFQLYDYQNRPHQLSDYQGRPLVLNFWASWCGPCRQEMSALAQTANRYKGKVNFLGVNLAIRDPLDSSKSLLQTANVQYPNLLDKSGKVAALYKIQGIPTTYLLDEKGNITHMLLGGVTAKELDQLLTQLLKK